MDTMKIKLTLKLALVLNGIDLTNRRVGEIFVLPSHDACVLIGDGWAEAVDEYRRVLFNFNGPAGDL
jgi:hypothetical protein